MKVLILGSGGMLGQALAEEGRNRGHKVLGAGRKHADLEIDLADDKALSDAIKSTGAELLVNCAAIVNVGLCDRDPLLAWKVNARAVGVMAEACRLNGVKFVQVSTDHYFTGRGNAKNDEYSPVVFFNEYARTKFAGEAFADICSDHLVLRTNIVGFRQAGDPTFSEWAFKSVTEDAEMTLFDDSFVSSIGVQAFSRALLDLAAVDVRGLYNLASSEVFSKREFIESIADSLGVHLTRATVGSVCSLPVSRAESCGLDVSRAEAVLGYKLPNLQEVIAELKTQWIKL